MSSCGSETPPCQLRAELAAELDGYSLHAAVRVITDPDLGRWRPAIGVSRQPDTLPITEPRRPRALFSVTRALVGIAVHSQAFNAFGTITTQARLSNSLVTTVGL